MKENKLKELRIRESLTQEELHKKTNITIAKISNYERGVTDPSLKTLYKLVGALKISNRDLREIVDYFGEGA